MRFSFPHSHAFPGGEVKVEDAEAAEGTCVTPTTFTSSSRPIARLAVRMSMRAAGGWSETRLEPGVRGDPSDRTLRDPSRNDEGRSTLSGSALPTRTTANARRISPLQTVHR